jgi:hypothetical protein
MPSINPTMPFALALATLPDTGLRSASPPNRDAATPTIAAGCAGAPKARDTERAAISICSASAQRSSETDNPTSITDVVQLTRSKALEIATPSSYKPGADGVIVKPNERDVTVRGNINGTAGTSLSIIAERATPKAAWNFTYLIGEGGTNAMVITQAPVAGKPGKFKTHFEASPAGMYPKIDAAADAANRRFAGETGPLRLDKAAAGGGVSATIDGQPIGVPKQRDLLPF